MTQLLEKAVAKVSALPDNEQDALASVLLTEMEAEQRWDQLFKSSQEVLGLMAREALEEYRAGETAPLDLERDFPKN
jgi:methylase of polypeptide subunit release factors